MNPQFINQENINQQLKLLAAHRERLMTRLEQLAMHGAAWAPPETHADIAAARLEIRRIKQVLRDWRVEVEDYPNDDLAVGSFGAPVDRLAVIPAGLARHIHVTRFKSLVEERTRNFVGREFVFQMIDDVLKQGDSASGYILIRGEPGIGKTAIMSELVRQRGYIHHFNIAAQGIQRTGMFLESVCAQLAVRYGLNYDVLPADADKNSGFFVQLLSEAAAKSVGSPVVIAIDALDEAEARDLSPQENILLLPPTLPRNVYVVVTSREKAFIRLVVDPSQLFPVDLIDDDPRNQADIRTFILSFIGRHAEVMALRIAAWSVSKEDFVDLLSEKSEGNFMYLVYVLKDILDGRLAADTVGNIHHLPHGLRQYYQRHWLMMQQRTGERFAEEHQQIVCAFAVAREPVGLEQIARWTTLSSLQIKQVVDEWSEFLQRETRLDGTRIYRIYHSSFLDFLEEEVGLKDSHQKIAKSTLGRIRKTGHP